MRSPPTSFNSSWHWVHHSHTLHGTGELYINNRPVEWFTQRSASAPTGLRNEVPTSGEPSRDGPGTQLLGETAGTSESVHLVIQVLNSTEYVQVQVLP